MSPASDPARRPQVVVAYVSGHGYGHYTRSAAVLVPLAERGVAVHLRTGAQPLPLARRTGAFASTAEVDVGPGVVQDGPLAVDVAATLCALQQHLGRFDAVVEEEARFVRDVGAELVFADVPPIAFAVAARAGVPSIGMSNFSWSWIYDGYAEADPRFAAIATRFAAAEALATRFLVLAGGGGLDVFPHREPIAPVARDVRFAKEAARARIARVFGDGSRDGDGRPLVLLTFGGFGGELDLRAALAACGELRLLVVSGPPDLDLPHARSIEPVEGALDHGGHAASAAAALSHPEITLAVDALVGKAGYGTFAECLRGRTPFVIVPRGEFREAGPLEAAIERWLPSARLSREALRSGDLLAAVRRALASAPPEPAPAPTGADEAVARIRSLLAPTPARAR